ncbi:PKD domain-containing protein [Ilyomonas limi]|uniref:PKD domain-containing protein n=1 Tax=Ilyomonas limi TaxID=2575867 RepID=A0A4U3KTK3_9BACT|nr:ThuA domain-containing protein [Ilyomonas limi]TKK65680.1 PKD domain-containing protein [Ilyomonas limi]
MLMKLSLRLLIIGLLVCTLFSCRQREGEPRILVFTKTAGFHHSSIPNGVDAIMKLGAQNNFEVDTTSDASMITEDTLKKYAAVVFLHTTGNLFNAQEQSDLERYIQAGGGFAGIHAAADANYDWHWYGRLVGGYFNGHPEQQEAVLHAVDKDTTMTGNIPATWKRKDEWYNFKSLDSNLHVLITIDESSYKGGTNGANHPMAWYHEFDGGRAWYTELGHTEESFTDPAYLSHLLAGIRYAIGDNKELNYSKVTALRAPDENRFTKTQLVQATFFEPTEMTILPNLDILVAQRRGELMLYKKNTNSVKQAGFLNVYYKTLHTQGVNSEEGLLGIQADPDYASNHYVYIYYSPVDSSVDRLSRFTFNNDTLDLSTEKVILEVGTTREICCHTGGSIAFGKDDELFVSTGDNSTPFDEPNNPPYNIHSFAPIDDRPGHEQWDSRRGAGNTNDLRGKILRIKINKDGTYGIPEGNLFPKGTDKTRPEIYVMGDRNPYRISVDKKNGYLYWGEVGPDANADSLDTRGPRGYDELNQAKKAGNFGWPYFVGNNYPYHEYDFNTGKTGPAFDPQHPVNDSRNNTGLRDLPPLSPAFIWYPYGESAEFPSVGSGGRTAMAGPAYYADMYPKETRYPDYYDKKVFIYEWIRGWIKAVSLTPNGDFDRLEPFMEGTKFNAPIDMEMGPDGRLYILEYGSGWFQKNTDAGLARIDYNSGNRPPAIASIKVDKTAGALPFNGKATVDVKDPDHDALSYKWTLGNGKVVETKTPTVDFNYTQAGDYNIQVEVKDDKGAVAKSDVVSVYAGNEIPDVTIQLGGNKSFYLPGKPIPYTVKVQDKGAVDNANLYISANFVEGYDRAGDANIGAGTHIAGRNLAFSMDCKTCHKEAEKSIGPAFIDVSKKYEKDPNAMNYLMNKVMKGGAGVWGDQAMPAHPNISQADLKQIIEYVMSLSQKTTLQKSLPPTGTITPPAGAKGNATLVVAASYTNTPANNLKALTGSNTVALPGSTVSFKGKEKVQGFTTFAYNGQQMMIMPPQQGWFAMDSIDLSGVSTINLRGGYQKTFPTDYKVEIHLDDANGKVIGTGTLSADATSKDVTNKLPIRTASAHCTIQPVTDGAFHTLYFVCTPVKSNAAGTAAILSVQFK